MPAFRETQAGEPAAADGAFVLLDGESAADLGVVVDAGAVTGAAVCEGGEDECDGGDGAEATRLAAALPLFEVRREAQLRAALA